MVQISPLALTLATKAAVAGIAALPYDVFNETEARAEVMKRPLSFLALDRPETLFAPGIDPYAEGVYRAAAALLQERIHTGLYEQQAPAYYLYELSTAEHCQCGIVAGFSADDYENGRIKRHELTRREKEDDRVRHIEALQAQTGPVFLIYRRNRVLQAIIDEVLNGQPLYDFTAAEGVRQRVFVVGSEHEKAITAAFAAMEAVYIADGHHRAAAAVRACRTVGNGRVLSVLFPEEQLQILPYHRVLKELCGWEATILRSRLEERYGLQKLSAAALPQQKGSVSVWLAGGWYSLSLPQERAAELDVAVLGDEILEDLLGITDIRGDQRIDFVGGCHPLSALEAYPLAFAMYPTAISELLAIADAGGIMPPKSTWFEPKLYSGLFLYRGEE
ncbi:MAG: DUF1015 family protein [Lachnospiraceae bacterium]|nr:DUF1015 family protein [Lachnospiraceae bacterium]MDY5742982.1 DUF1015 family protein [Lachnospiraceae bacterium]